MCARVPTTERERERVNGEQYVCVCVYVARESECRREEWGTIASERDKTM